MKKNGQGLEARHLHGNVHGTVGRMFSGSGKSLPAGAWRHPLPGRRPHKRRTKTGCGSPRCLNYPARPTRRRNS